MNSGGRTILATAASVTDDTGQPGERVRPELFWVTAVAVAWPFALAAARAVRRDWYPTGDDGIVAFRSMDVLTRRPPLLGTWSSASFWSREWINHPGPLQFDLLAVPVRLLGAGPGLAFGTAASNLLSVLVAGWLVRRRAGTVAASVMLVLAGSLAWSMGSELLFDPWSQFAPLFPFLCFVFAVWSVAEGDLVALPIAAFTGSFLLQTHLSYVLLVPGLGVWAMTGLVLHRRRQRHADPDGWHEGRSRRRAWTAGSALLTVVVWSQPLYEQLTRHPGNMTSLVRAAGAKPPNTPGLGGALQAVGDVVALPPWWLPTGWENPSFRLDGSGRPVALVAIAFAVLLAGLVALLILSARRSDLTANRAISTALVLLILSFASVAKSTSPLGLDASYVRWLWPSSVFIWFAIGLSVIRLRSPRVSRTDGVAVMPSERRWRSRPVAAAGAVGVAAFIVAALASPRVDHGTSAYPWAPPVAQRVASRALPQIRRSGPVLVRILPSQGAFQVGPAVLSIMHAEGIPVVVEDESLVRQLGEQRRNDGRADRTLDISGGLDVLSAPRPGYHRLAASIGLDPSELRLRRELRDRLLVRIQKNGGIRFRRSLDSLPVGQRSDLNQIRSLSMTDPARVLDGTLLLLPRVLKGFLELDVLGKADVDRYIDLHRRLRDESVALDLLDS